MNFSKGNIFYEEAVRISPFCYSSGYLSFITYLTHLLLLKKSKKCLQDFNINCQMNAQLSYKMYESLKFQVGFMVQRFL